VIPTPEALIARKTDSEPVPVPVMVCAWCPDFDRTTATHASHGICPSCRVRLEQEQKQEIG